LKVFKDENAKCSDLFLNDDHSPLHGENARPSLKKFIKEQILSPRESQLRAIAKGFFLDNTFSVVPFLEICSSPKELRLLLCGEETFDVDRLWEIIDFQGFMGRKEQIAKEQLRGALGAMTEKELRLFLRFVTGLYALPINSKAEALHITVKPDNQVTDGVRFPQAQTCDRQLTLPEYLSQEEMLKRLREAIQPENSLFMMK